MRRRNDLAGCRLPRRAAPKGLSRGEVGTGRRRDNRERGAGEVFPDANTSAPKRRGLLLVNATAEEIQLMAREAHLEQTLLAAAGGVQCCIIGVICDAISAVQAGVHGVSAR